MTRRVVVLGAIGALDAATVVAAVAVFSSADTLLVAIALAVIGLVATTVAVRARWLSRWWLLPPVLVLVIVAMSWAAVLIAIGGLPEPGVAT